MTTTLLYDGSLNGLLTAIFTIYDHKIKLPIISKASNTQKNLFDGTEIVITDTVKAQRVWKRFESICNHRDSYQVYCAFLSEITGMENTIYEYIKMTFQAKKAPGGDFTNPVVLKIAQAAKMVGREKHRMEAFVRFHLIDEETYYANIEPDFNVLPLIVKHFKNRYADQNWIIYDLSRDYGISYNQINVQEVHIEFKTPKGQRGILNNNNNSYSHKLSAKTKFEEVENNYRDLWNQYFKSTNIQSRKNIKLHLQHVPKRYWKYLSEKV
ncbi:DNA metabolism protein [Nonlabens arenilitoris]|uniref:DNA metabolism protein n=1 Tax=Nonlabens arenilitoris TaxID=1217969 RepID=A0A2S7U9J9_9FLAO|nr:TIGR03915 family putative DNA repair protein [Nonlabens arenilitoris]PQJ31261.1 DNA metabolism protein [Nonlabens arenilitoris]